MLFRSDKKEQLKRPKMTKSNLTVHNEKNCNLSDTSTIFYSFTVLTTIFCGNKFAFVINAICDLKQCQKVIIENICADSSLKVGYFSTKNWPFFNKKQLNRPLLETIRFPKKEQLKRPKMTKSNLTGRNLTVHRVYIIHDLK